MITESRYLLSAHLDAFVDMGDRHDESELVPTVCPVVGECSGEKGSGPAA